MIDINKFRNYAEQIYQHTWPKHLPLEKQVEHLNIGLLSELGELLGVYMGHIDKLKFKPNYYDGYPRKRIKDEMGDCLYYATIANYLDRDSHHSLCSSFDYEVNAIIERIEHNNEIYDWQGYKIQSLIINVMKSINDDESGEKITLLVIEIFCICHSLSLDVNELIDHNLKKLIDSNNKNKNGWIK